MTSWRAGSSVSTPRSEGGGWPRPSLGDGWAAALPCASLREPSPGQPTGAYEMGWSGGGSGRGPVPHHGLSSLGLFQHHKLSSPPRDARQCRPRAGIHSSARASHTTVRARPCHGPRIKFGVTIVGTVTASTPPLTCRPASPWRRVHGRRRRPGPNDDPYARPCPHPASAASRRAPVARRAGRPPSMGGRPRRSAR